MEVFGSLDAIRNASVDDLEKGGLPRSVASALYDHLRIEENDANREGAE
jgi:excinuclease UvrABC nuclease subunit